MSLEADQVVEEQLHVEEDAEVCTNMFGISSELFDIMYFYVLPTHATCCGSVHGVALIMYFVNKRAHLPDNVIAFNIHRCRGLLAPVILMQMPMGRYNQSTHMFIAQNTNTCTCIL